MGSKPKKQDYQPSETEKIQAAVASADAEYFKKTYDPLLVEMRDVAAKEDVAGVLRGRAQADTMQTLTSNLQLPLASDVNASANVTIGAIGQMLSANTTAKGVKTAQQTGVLGTARGQAADAGDALAQASKLARSEGLSRAQAKQTVRLARNQAKFDIGKAVAKKMWTNLQSGSGSALRTRGTDLAKHPETGEYGYWEVGPFGTGREFISASGATGPNPNIASYTTSKGDVEPLIVK